MRRFSFGIATPVLVAALAIAMPVPAQDDPWKSETFLGDYTQLKPVPSKTGQVYLYIAPGAEEKLARFDKVMVDQPEISVGEDSPYKNAKPDDLKAIAEFMRSTLVERLEARGYKVVDKPGETVLYLRSALTHLQLKKKKRGVLAYTPIGAVVHGVKGAVQSVMKNLDIVDMAGQAEVSASDTGEVLGAMVNRLRAPSAEAAGERPERMTFDEFKAHLDEHGDRLACRLDNARRPADQRVDCMDPDARKARTGGSPGS